MRRKPKMGTETGISSGAAPIKRGYLNRKDKISGQHRRDAQNEKIKTKGKERGWEQ